MNSEVERCVTLALSMFRIVKKYESEELPYGILSLDKEDENVWSTGCSDGKVRFFTLDQLSDGSL